MKLLSAILASLLAATTFASDNVPNGISVKPLEGDMFGQPELELSAQSVTNFFTSKNFQSMANSLKKAASTDKNFLEKFKDQVMRLETEVISTSDFNYFWKISKKVLSGNSDTKLYNNSDLSLKDSLVFRVEHDPTDLNIYENDIENEKPYDAVCDTYSSKYMPYTGFRFATTVTLGHFLLRKKTSHLVYCYQGKEVSRSSRVHSIGRTDILWGEKYCFTLTGSDYDKTDSPIVEGCYVPVRNFRAHLREGIQRVSWNRPERFYGGLFKYVDKEDGGPKKTSGGLFDLPVLDNDRAIPVSPLISDEPFMGFASRVPNEKKFNLFMPIAYTPDYFSEGYPVETDQWAVNMDINEQYTPPGSFFDDYDTGPMYEYIPLPKKPVDWDSEFKPDSLQAKASSFSKSVSSHKRRKMLARRLSSFTPFLNLVSQDFESLNLSNLPKNPRDYVSILKSKILPKKSAGGSLDLLFSYVKHNVLGQDYDMTVEAQWGSSATDNYYSTSTEKDKHSGSDEDLYREFYDNPYDRFKNRPSSDRPERYKPEDDPYRSPIPQAEPSMIEELLEFFIDAQMRLVVNQLKTRLLFLEDKRLAKYLYMTAYYYVFPY